MLVEEIYVTRTTPESIMILWYRDDDRCLLLEGRIARCTKLSTIFVGLATRNASFPRVATQALG